MRLLPLASGLALLTGCIVERDYAPADRLDFESAPRDDVVERDFVGVLPIADGRIRGDIGAVRDFDAPTDYVDSWGDGAYTNVTLNATDAEGRVGMIILELMDFDLESAPAGTYTAQSTTGAGEIWVTGCSSDESSFYDAPADDGTVIVQDQPDGTRDVVIQATLPGDTERTQASARFTLD